MTAEILYGDYFLFGDEANVGYLRKCLPDWEFVLTDISKTPYFAENEPDLIYMGGMSESSQLRVIDALTPFKDRLCRVTDGGTHILFTSNACDILGNYIQNGDTRIKALGIFDFHVEADMMKRFNGMTLGEYGNIEIVGYLSQFGRAYPEEGEREFFLPVTRGSGLNSSCKFEGFKRNNFIATYLIGPFLVLNPKFTKMWLSEITDTEIALPFEKEAMRVYEQRLREFKDPNRKIC
ncbi:MAG: hypothetical protein LUG85_01035 [Clostridiales bacterium]|nr:hypothetical protein [Clostridiales bacterium]